MHIRTARCRRHAWLLGFDVATVKVTNEPITNFSLTNSKGKWPSGVYRPEIRSDGQLVHTARFTVR
jgi:hypothetical protein